MVENTIIKKSAEKGVLDINKIRKDFPVLNREVHGKKLVYLDNAATTQKPRAVIEALVDYYSNTNANVHRGLHTLAEEATSAFEETRSLTAGFIGAEEPAEIIYTRNATEAINLVAYSWGRKNIRKGDRIVLTEMEHHANLVPWIVLAKETGAELAYIPIDDNGCLDLDDLGNIITPNTKLVAFMQMSNVLGTINPAGEIIEKAHKRGAITLVDGAQSAPHMPVDVKSLDADFYAFSAHKMLGPTGVGFLYGKREILDRMEPFNTGGEMINEVRYDYADWNDLPHKFEAGTPNIADVIAFKPALEYLNNVGMDAVREHERELTEYALGKMLDLGFVKIFGPTDSAHRGGAISFIVDDIHSHDMATMLDTRGIAVRAGHHCAQPLMKRLGVSSTTRASFYIYNTREEIDEFIASLVEIRRYFSNV
ncbi:MAG: SufS family cysteine desulfurase [candidate division Zixibacteria bacterium]|nr:SufS family cysteine desulfurase [candidate division Zixibacteria bacterium]